MTKKMKRRSSGEVDTTATIMEWVGLKRMYDELGAKVTTLRDKVKTIVDSMGDSDDKGSRWLEVEGVPGVKALKHERRAKTYLDHEDAITLLEKRDLLDRCSQTTVVIQGFWDPAEIEALFESADVGVDPPVEVVSVDSRLNEDEVYACVYDDDADLTAEDVLSVTKTSETWALKIEAE